jgi:hypothetical protein
MFTISAVKREATTFTCGTQTKQPKHFFTHAPLERVMHLHGVHPDIDFVRIAAFVDNARS